MATIAAGVELSGHLLSEEIGRGGYSRVFRAVPPGGGPAVAIKFAIDPALTHALKEEGATLRRLTSPRFVRILEEHLDADPPYFVLELCEGGDLGAARDAAPDRRLPPARVHALARAILEGVAFAHDEGVVHGDLEPENVLLDRGGGLHLADFGLSRRISQRTATLSVSLSQEDARLAGTLDYMAPEQRSGQKPTARSDVYACGVILYELLAGSRPQGVFQLPGALDQAVPPGIDRLVACALAQDPRHRFATAGAMLAFLRAHPKEEWKALALAHRRVSALLGPNGILTALAEPGTFLVGMLLVGSTWGAALGSIGSIIGTGRAVLGTLIGIGVTYALYVAIRPWLLRRQRDMLQLRTRLEEQIKTGKRWSGVR